MLIAVNTRFLIHDKLEGIGRFSFEILSRMTRSHPEHQFIFFFDRSFDNEFIFSKNVTGIRLFPPARHPFLFYWWFEFSVSAALKKYKPDVFLSLDGFLSLNTKTPSVPVIHDLAFIHYPDGLSFFERNYYNYFFPRFAQKAKRIIAVSNYTKTDIIKQYTIEADKIDIAYNASATGFIPVDQFTKKKFKDKYTNGSEYFIYVGALHPRKNIDTLLNAFEAFKESSKSDHKLLIVGRMAWQTDDIEKIFNKMKFKNEVVFTGRISDDELNKVMASAFCLVYIPFFEGFGLPIVEAMACDVPVITSNVTSMPEVAGDAAILVDPHSMDETKNAMLSIINDDQLRAKLIEGSKKRKSFFDWNQSANDVWQSIMKAVNK